MFERGWGRNGMQACVLDGGQLPVHRAVVEKEPDKQPDVGQDSQYGKNR